MLFFVKTSPEFNGFSHLKVWTKVDFFVILYTFDPLSAGLTFKKFCKCTTELCTTLPMPCGHYVHELRLPFFDIDWFVDGCASDVGVLSV